MRTQVAIVGAGPAGLLLGRLLSKEGIDNIIVERRAADYVLSRIRAGVLESSTTALLDEAGAGERMRREGLVHDSVDIVFGGNRHRFDLKELTGKSMLVYGQTEITRDLMNLRALSGDATVYSADNVSVRDMTTERPKVRFDTDGIAQEIECDFIAGCDGFHGVCRKSIPAGTLTTYEHTYPFGWLGILVDKPLPLDALTYICSERGFALCSQRSATRSRLYIQCSAHDRIEDWSDGRFYDELSVRLDMAAAQHLQRGQSIEKSITPLRSFVAEPMRYGNLFLAGDAAHIVPPTGAKGLNLAVGDVFFLWQALGEYYRTGMTGKLDQYSQRALQRVWKAERFSFWMTSILHAFPTSSAFERRMQQIELEVLASSRAAKNFFAENYIGFTY